MWMLKQNVEIANGQLASYDANSNDTKRSANETNINSSRDALTL